jgi:homoserine kinase
MHSYASVRVPATTANLGPGFDCLGLALDLWNTVRLERGPSGVQVSGEGAESLSRGDDNLVCRAAAALFREIGGAAPDIAVVCHNDIPLARGLGSSAAAVVGGLVAANALCGEPLSRPDLMRLAVEMEGHPDNVAPALLGGCQVSVMDGDDVVTSAVPLPEGLRAVLFVPEQPMPTAQARALLPLRVSRDDAVFNIGRTALLVSALATGDLDAVRVATQDRLHQPYRSVLFPSMRLIIQAALDAGAAGAFLSGAGSTVLALARGREMTIGFEMTDAADKAGVAGEVRVVEVSATGAHVVEVG